MVDLTGLNRIANNGFLPSKKIKEMTPGHNFMVSKLRKANTRFGVRIVAELDEEFQVFLPAGVSEELKNNEQLYTQLLEAVQKMRLFIVYNGQNIEFSFV